MSDVPSHFRLVQDARYQLCQVWCLPGTGPEGLGLRLAQCLWLEKGGIAGLVEGKIHWKPSYLMGPGYFFCRFFLEPTHGWKEVSELG